jgi:adenosylcobinamide-GDP ribazoletransferase
MLRAVKNLFAFLTIIPFRMDENCLNDCANSMYLFPLIGSFIGLLAGLIGWAVSFFLPSLLVGAIVLGFLLLITGLHHMDGLLDFGDGVMAHGSAERKIEIMHDQLTGAGGLTLGMMTLLTTAICIGGIKQPCIIPSLIVAEASAKLAMVVGAWAGRPVHKGMSSAFSAAMHGRHGNLRLLIAFLIAFAVALPLLWLAGFIALAVSVLASFILVLIAHRNFNGITGDVLGATNELARMTSLIAMVAMLR